MKPHWFFNDTYFANVYFCPGWKDQDLFDFIQRQFGIQYSRPLLGDGRCIEIEDDDGRWGLVIHTRYKDNGTKSVAALTHECLHATNNVLRRVGVKVELGENDEAQTYLLGWFINRCYPKLKGVPKDGK